MDKKEIISTDIRYEHLLGKQYVPGKVDCGSLIKDFYKDNFGHDFPDYSRPDGWWKVGMNLYYEIAQACGFRPVDIPITKMQIGDVMLMGFSSQFPNHSAIYVGNGEVIHHFYDRLSARDPISGAMRDTLLAIMRRPDIIIKDPEVETLRLEDFLTPYWKQRLKNDPIAAEYLDKLKSGESVAKFLPPGGN